MRPRTSLLAAALGLALLSGCGGPATFISAEPPPDTKAEAWFASSHVDVRSALRKAMTEKGLAVVPGDADAELVGTKQQLPYVDEESGEPASGPLPLYRLRADIERSGETHVRLTLFAECSACNGSALYEWEYPGELLRAVLESARGMLQEKRARFVYPVRYRAPAWRRPPHR